MKKKIAKICAFILVVLILVIMIVIVIIVFSFDYEGSKRPNDTISKAICEAVGKKNIYYQGKKSDNSFGIVIYDYLVHNYEDETVLTDMIEAANAVVEEKKITQKIRLVIREEMPGGTEAVGSLRNYYEGEDGYEQYGSFQNLNIYGTERSNKGNASPYNKASTYINLPDIKSLIVSEKIAQSAAEEGIDWYEIWPDLEYYEVLED